MKAFIFLCLYIFVLSTSLSAQQEAKEGSIAYLTDGLDDIKYKDAKLAFAMWSNELAKNKNVEVETVFYSSHVEIMKDYKNRVFEALSINPIYYLQYQESIDAVSSNYYVAQRTKNSYEKLLLLVRKDSNIKNFKDLKNRVVAVRSDSYQAELFLNKEIMQELKRDSKGYIKEFKKTEKFTTAVLNVFFKKVDACIVPEYVLKLVSEMNPAVARALTPIAQSQVFFMPAMTIFHKDTAINLADTYKQSIKNLELTVRGKNILTLFKMNKIRFIEFSELDALKTYYKEYLALKKRYRVENE